MDTTTEHEPAEDRELLAEVGDCVRTLVLLLEAPHRDILMLVELGGVSVSEAARALDLSVAQTRVRLHHARNALRGLLSLSCATCPHTDCAGCSCDGCAAVSGGKHECT